MRASHLEDFYAFLRFPSVSTDDDYSEKLTECGALAGREKLNQHRPGSLSFVAERRGHPVVWARNKHQPGPPAM